MNDEPIANETEYEAALATLSRLMDLDPDVTTDPSPESVNAQISALAARIEAYEKEHYPMEPS